MSSAHRPFRSSGRTPTPGSDLRALPILIEEIVVTARLREESTQDIGQSIRARVTYFHQVGYYTIGYNESLDARMALLPMYVYVLTGKFTPEEIAEHL